MEFFETFSTTADVGIRIRGKGYDGLFHSALKGLNLLLFDCRFDRVSPLIASFPQTPYPFEFHGDSPENLLVNFLSEILFLIQQENLITTGLSIHHIDDTHIKADLLCIPLFELQNLQPELEIKSVTYHNLEVKDHEGIKSAEIIFDI